MHNVGSVTAFGPFKTYLCHSVYEFTVCQKQCSTTVLEMEQFLVLHSCKQPASNTKPC